MTGLNYNYLSHAAVSGSLDTRHLSKTGQEVVPTHFTLRKRPKHWFDTAILYTIFSDNDDFHAEVSLSTPLMLQNCVVRCGHTAGHGYISNMGMTLYVGHSPTAVIKAHRREEIYLQQEEQPLLKAVLRESDRSVLIYDARFPSEGVVSQLRMENNGSFEVTTMKEDLPIASELFLIFCAMACETYYY